MKRRCTCVFLRVVYVKVHSPRKAACALSCLLSTPRRTYKLRITVSNVDFSRGHLREVNSPSLVLLVSASSDMTYKLRITVSNVDFSRGHLREVNSPSKNLVFLVLLVSASSDMKRSCTCVFLRVVYVKAHPPPRKAACALSFLLSPHSRTYKLRIYGERVKCTLFYFVEKRHNAVGGKI